jgi:hypothetical protein
MDKDKGLDDEDEFEAVCADCDCAECECEYLCDNCGEDEDDCGGDCYEDEELEEVEEEGD